MFRSPRWIEDQLDRVLVRHEARVGYSTAFWSSVRCSVGLVDRTGWYAGLLGRAAAPYPEQLVRAVVARNQPLLRRNHGSYLRQLENAVERGDRVSVNHRTAAFLASVFDLLFALNREPHPGEKRLVALAEARCPLRPPALARDVEALLAAAAVPGPELLRRADRLGEELDQLLRGAGLIEGAPSGDQGARGADRPRTRRRPRAPHIRAPTSSASAALSRCSEAWASARKRRSSTPARPAREREASYASTALVASTRRRARSSAR